MVCQLADLAGDELEPRVERAAHRGIGNEAALVRLGGAQLGQLAQPGDQRGELPLAPPVNVGTPDPCARSGYNYINRCSGPPCPLWRLKCARRLRHAPA